MTDHYYQFDHHSRRHRVFKRMKWFITGTLLAVLVIFTVLFFTTSFFVQRETPPVTSNVQTSVQAPSAMIFRTPYFQFQAGKSWVEAARESRHNTYVYRSFRGTLIEDELTVYVNPPENLLTSLKSTRVQPVTINADGSLEAAGGISESCSTSVKTVNRDPAPVKLEGVSFTCHVDSTIFDVLAGQVEGSPLLAMRRPNEEAIKYVLYYKDLRAMPSGRELKEIVDSFQAR